LVWSGGIFWLVQGACISCNEGEVQRAKNDDLDDNIDLYFKGILNTITPWSEAPLNLAHPGPYFQRNHKDSTCLEGGEVWGREGRAPHHTPHPPLSGWLPGSCRRWCPSEVPPMSCLSLASTPLYCPRPGWTRWALESGQSWNCCEHVDHQNHEEHSYCWSHKCA
jgi:hypothetical protein